MICVEMGEMYIVIKLAEDVLRGLHYFELFLQRQRLQLHQLKLSFIRRLGMGNKTCFTRLIGREQNVIGQDCKMNYNHGSRMRFEFGEFYVMLQIIQIL